MILGDSGRKSGEDNIGADTVLVDGEKRVADEERVVLHAAERLPIYAQCARRCAACWHVGAPVMRPASTRHRSRLSAAVVMVVAESAPSMACAISMLFFRALLWHGDGAHGAQGQSCLGRGVGTPIISPTHAVQTHADGRDNSSNRCTTIYRPTDRADANVVALIRPHSVTRIALSPSILPRVGCVGKLVALMFLTVSFFSHLHRQSTSTTRQTRVQCEKLRELLEYVRLQTLSMRHASAYQAAVLGAGYA